VKFNNYISDFVNFKRFPTRSLKLNHFDIGGENPIRLQSMVNTLTTDIDATVSQIIRIIEKGADYVRITTPTLKDVLALDEIRQKIRINYETPLIADIHFSPKVALAALDVVEKIRINPGNFVARNRKIEYDNDKYNEEIEKIEKEFLPIIEKAKRHKKIIRIGTNIGSLSERILQKYGATPLAMVQASLEYIKIARKNDFKDLVISLKASNPRLNIWTNRLLLSFFKDLGYDYPIHIGVTEAGNGLEGRIKSAVGIGALLVDGIGDTIRVSLTEAPENEIPIAREIVNHVMETRSYGEWQTIREEFFNPYDYSPRQVVNNFLPQYPIIIINAKNYYKFDSPFIPDFIFVDNENLSKHYKADGIKLIGYNNSFDYKYLKFADIEKAGELMAFVEIKLEDLKENKHFNILKKIRNTCLVFTPSTVNVIAETRIFLYEIIKRKIDLPIVLKLKYSIADLETFAIKVAIDSGIFFIDGLINGLWIENEKISNIKDILEISFEILQASNARTSKVEIIACPSCGRSTFDVEEVTNLVKLRFKNIKDIKVAIMGCIVNGLGEMADADFAYVGTSPGKISLYYKRKLIKHNIDKDKALDELDELIRNKEF